VKPCYTARKSAIDPRALRHRVTLQQRVAGVDALGQAVETWATLAEVWAAVEPLRGRELFAAAQAQAPTTVRITVRYLAGLTAAARVLWEGKAHDVEAVIDVEGAHEKLELMCTTALKDAHA
jgi:SPP1 family predicted phage head-tail adaptor